MEERAPLDRRSLQHTSKEPEAQIWAQIGTPQYNPTVPQTSETAEKVTSPLESYKIPKLGSSSNADESTKTSGEGHDEDSDEELQVDENAETVLAEAEPEPSGSATTAESAEDKAGSEAKPSQKKEEDKDDTKATIPEEDSTPYTSSNDPKFIKARVFVGQLTPKCTKKDVEKVFEPFGKLLGVLLLKGYGFVQFEDEECAMKAIKDAHGAEICGSKIVCDRPMALKQLLRDERRRKRGSPESMRQRERELLEELDYLRRREYDRFSRLEELDRYYHHERASEYPMRPPVRDPYYDYPFERPFPPPVDRYERFRMDELERAHSRDRYPPPHRRSASYDRPRDDPFEDRRHFHRDPYDHYDMPPPHRRY